MEDHDQRFKVLLTEFLDEFFALFFSRWKDRFDWGSLEKLEDEAFLNPPRGESRFLDLVFRVRTRIPVQVPAGVDRDACLVIIHVEVESKDSSTGMGFRMSEYRHHLSVKYNLAVFQVCLFLRVGLDGLGWGEYVETLWEEETARIRYAYVGLPALNGLEYVERPELLAVALAALMKIPDAERARIKAEGLARIARSTESDLRKYLLAECMDTYLTLSPAQESVYQQLQRQRPEVMMIKNKWVEQGRQEAIDQLKDKWVEEGRKEALDQKEKWVEEGRKEALDQKDKWVEEGMKAALDQKEKWVEEGRKAALDQKEKWVEEGLRRGLEKQTRVLLQAKFGELPAAVAAQLSELPADRLEQLGVDLLSARSLAELGLGTVSDTPK